MIRDLLSSPTSGLALLYHDIVPRKETDTSGFVTDGSWRYKLAPEMFDRHLSVIADSAFEPALITDKPPNRPVYLTFDDGGQTAMEAARRLEAYGYRGHFFIVLDRVGEDGFLDWNQIHTLDQRGHCIGSHTMTHANLLKTNTQRRQQELTESKAAIAAELGQCQSLSIPLGAYNEEVFKAVYEAGYEYIFTSEPVRIPQDHLNQRLGRWNIWYDTDPDELAAILRASPPIVLQTVVRWYGVKFVKQLLGYNRFIRIRDVISFQ
ncbi:polysaccharide deacetylase family protein [Haloarcula sp. H-GB4]|uniref:polysaccharide deacetylase family protein n=1 Tax=Haloarcula sp. H-GB4 TaxID=3069755 RepID=UPI0027B752EA|nr:polysaccharide deacetylase family protein [Haloarcula sp. H-GB4]MDQ2072864.1 polysaccharide deacetylase family protein [Haloarcula sp. H-GB4]